MLDFKEEISKYKPILGVKDIEKSVNNDDVKDIMDLLAHLSKQINTQRPGKDD